MKLFFTILGLASILSIHSQSALKAVHEWGTFTTVHNSAGQRLSGLKGEKLPKFVYDLGLSDRKNLELKNIEVQMETPVLYFYADEELDAQVDVKFKKGVINQWYPSRFSGKLVNTTGVLDFANIEDGGSVWKINILSPDKKGKLIEDWTQLTAEYAAPRYTNSNVIKAQGREEYEKFIFYRGLANFETPVHVELNQKNNLVIHNKFAHTLTYVMVYDNSPDRQPTIWWSGKLNAQEKKVILHADKDSEFNEVSEEVNKFRDELVNAGLYKDEADAMLNTWFEGYFVDVTDVEGLRVFWITPRQYVDEILPITIAPQPNNFNRVFIGRTEIFKKEFESELASLTEDEIRSKYKDHHYLDVMLKGKIKGFPTQWTDYNGTTLSTESNQVKNTLQLKLMPNPITESMIISFKPEGSEKINFIISDAQGQIIKEWSEEATNTVMKKTYPLHQLPSGQYFLQSNQGIKREIVRFVVR